jgi:hypothetical protein
MHWDMAEKNLPVKKGFTSLIGERFNESVL